MSVKPSLGGLAAVLLLPPSRQRDDESVIRPSILTDAPAGIKAVQPRQTDVQKDHVGVLPRRRVDRLLAVIRDGGLIPGQPYKTCFYYVGRFVVETDVLTIPYFDSLLIQSVTVTNVSGMLLCPRPENST